MCDLLKVDDPVIIKQAIGKKLSVQTTDNKHYEGYLYVIDPESGTVVLINETKSFLFPRHALKELQVISHDVLNTIVDTKEMELDEETLKQSKEHLKDWLKLNLIEVVEEGNILKYQDYLHIEPPYDLEHCYCNNTIVLERIKDIIKKMPNKI